MLPLRGRYLQGQFTPCYVEELTQEVSHPLSAEQGCTGLILGPTPATIGRWLFQCIDQRWNHVSFYQCLNSGKGFDRRVCYLHGHHDDFLCSALCTKEIQLSPKKAFGLISLVLLAEIIYYDASWSPVSKALSYLLSFNSLNTVKYPADFESGKKDSKSAPLMQGCLLQILN